VFLVRLKGDLDMNVLGGDREKMTAVIEVMHLYTKNILIDFKKVTNTDSATVAALMGRLLDIEKFKKRIGLFNIPEHFRQLIEVLKVEHNFLIYDSESTALTAFQ
jgi:anti-sigma B factor antagonist